MKSAKKIMAQSGEAVHLLDASPNFNFSFWLNLQISLK
jgi:hypothetical protein